MPKISAFGVLNYSMLFLNGGVTTVTTSYTGFTLVTVAGVDYTDIAISDIAHQAGRDDIYTQPNPSYLQVALVALSGQTLPFQIKANVGT